MLDTIVAKAADNLCFHHAKSHQEKVRTYTSFTYQASSWKRPRKVVARPERSLQPDEEGPAQDLYEDVYCQRGQMENLIKLHKARDATARCPSSRSSAIPKTSIAWIGTISPTATATPTTPSSPPLATTSASSSSG